MIYSFELYNGRYLKISIDENIVIIKSILEQNDIDFFKMILTDENCKIETPADRWSYSDKTLKYYLDLGYDNCLISINDYNFIKTMSKKILKQNNII